MNIDNIANTKSSPVESEIQRWDDYMLHQVAAPLYRMGDSAQENWFEHTEMMLIPPSKDLPLVNSQFSVHPNEGLMHGFTLVLHQRGQHNIRGCRFIGPDRADSTIGPISQKVVEPFNKWTVLAEATPGSGFTVEADCIATTKVQSWPRFEYKNPDGQGLHTMQSHLIQLAKVHKGELKMGQQTWNLAGWNAFRDHCWGHRKFHAPGSPSAHTWLPAYFPSRKMLMLHTEDRHGTPMYSYAQLLYDNVAQGDPVSEIKMTISKQAGNPRPTGVRWKFLDSKGSTHLLQVDQIDLSRGLLFSGGWSGENPDDYKGPLRVEADYWDEGKRLEVANAGGRKSMARYLVEYDLDSERGHGVLACFMAPDYAPKRP